MITSMDKREATQRVARGAALLDEAIPDWADRVDVPTLDLRHSTLCILGQVYGDYVHGLTRLFPYSPVQAREEAVKCGFTLGKPGAMRGDGMLELYKVWIAEVTSRQSDSS